MSLFCWILTKDMRSAGFHWSIWTLRAVAGFCEYESKICRLFQITNLMHNSFIFQQYICYTTLHNIFRAARCSSSGGQIVPPQPLVSSVCRWRADCSPPSTCILYSCLQRVTIPEAVVIQLVLLRMSSVLLETC